MHGGPRHCADDCEPGAHCPLSIVLVRLGPAEVGEHAVAHELGDMTFEPRHLARDRALIVPEQRAHLLRIKARGECRRADEIDEHDCEVPALGCSRNSCQRHSPLLRHVLRVRISGGGLRISVQCRDGLQQLHAVAERQAKFLEVMVRELGQHLGVDGVVAEYLLVAVEPESSEPDANVHRAVTEIGVPLRSQFTSKSGR